MHLSCLSERKDTAVRAWWVKKKKKTDQWHKPTSLWFLHDCDQLLVCLYSQLQKTLKTNPSSSVFMHGDIVVHLTMLCLHAWTGVYSGSHAVLWESMKPRADCHHSIMMTDKTQSSCRHSGLAWAPSAAVASWASDCAGRSLYLRAICSDKSWDKDSSATHLPPSCSQHERLQKIYRVNVRGFKCHTQQLHTSMLFLPQVNMQSNNKKCSLVLLYFSDIPSPSPGWSGGQRSCGQV